MRLNWLGLITHNANREEEATVERNVKSAHKNRYGQKQKKESRDRRITIERTEQLRKWTS